MQFNLDLVYFIILLRVQGEQKKDCLHTFVVTLVYDKHIVALLISRSSVLYLE